MSNQETEKESGAKYRACAGVLFSAVGSEGVLLSSSEGAYYGLDEIGVKVWTSLTTGTELTEIHGRLLDEYEVDAEKLRCDLVALVDDLLKQNLLETDSPR